MGHCLDTCLLAGGGSKSLPDREASPVSVVMPLRWQWDLGPLWEALRSSWGLGWVHWKVLAQNLSGCQPLGRAPIGRKGALPLLG